MKGTSKNEDFRARARKHRAQNRSVYDIHEDSSTELTQLSCEKTVFRGALNKVLRRLSLTMLLLVFSVEVYPAAPAAYEGQRLFVSYCQLCHGEDGKGGGPLAKAMKITPADLTTTVRSRSDTILRKIITGEGRQTITGRERHNLLSESMPEWGEVFDQGQIEALIAYLRFLGRAEHQLMGDPEVGSRLYRKYCQVCHGEEGDGDGIMTNLIGITPMDHTNPNETNRLDNEELMKSILDGKGRFMPAWRGILSDSDVEGLVSYIRLLSQ